MNRVRIRVFAKSLFNVSKEEGVLDEVIHDLTTMATVFKKHPDLAKRLVNPLISLEQRLNIVRETCASSHGVVGRFMEYIVRQYAVNALEDILEVVNELVVESEGGMVASLIVPGPITQAEVDAIKDRVEAITKRKPEFKIIENPAMIGGFIFKSESYLIDASMKGYLKKLTGGGLHGAGG